LAQSHEKKDQKNRNELRADAPLHQLIAIFVVEGTAAAKAAYAHDQNAGHQEAGEGDHDKEGIIGHRVLRFIWMFSAT